MCSGPKSRATSLSGARSRRAILDRALSLLKPGGVLVYCTCSLEPEEGEAQIAALLRRNPDAAREQIDPAAFGLPPEAANSDGDLRLLPFFLAR